MSEDDEMIGPPSWDERYCRACGSAWRNAELARGCETTHGNVDPERLLARGPLRKSWAAHRRTLG